MGNRMKKLLCVLSALAVLSVASVGFVGAASACSWAGPIPFHERQDAPPAEATFPEAVTLELIKAYRDTDLTSGDSCRPTGIVQIAASYEDVTDYGLLWKIVKGTTPPFFGSPIEPVQAEEVLYLRWNEDKDILQESYEFQITATWVDAWGREGNPSEPLLILVPAAEPEEPSEPSEPEDSSCSHIAGSNPAQSSLVWAGLCVMVLVVRRKFLTK